MKAARAHGAFSSAVAEIGHSQHKFILHQVTHSTHPAILRAYAANDKIAPFAGQSVDQKVVSLHERLDQPGRILLYATEESRPEELCATLQTALASVKVKGIPTNLDQLLAGTDLTNNGSSDTLLMFSIWGRLNARGAADFIADRTTKLIEQEHPQIERMTLSPVNGFRAAITALPREERHDMLFDMSVGAFLDNLHEGLGNKNHMRRLAASEPFTRDLARYCADYLLTMKNGRVLCSAGNFHMRRGAYLRQVNAFASTTEHALTNCLQMTANYVYPRDPKVLARNRDLFAQGKLVRSRTIQNLIGIGHHATSRNMVVPV